MTEIVGLLRGANNNNDNFYTSIETNKTFRIGRHLENDLVISHNIISPIHCEITSKKDLANDIKIVYLTDLSINGTYLNGSLIGTNRTVVLLSGSIISFASEHINMMYVEKSNTVRYDEEVTVNFVPGSLVHPDQKLAHHPQKEIKNTSKVIGCGGQADVFLAYDRFRSSNQLACKRIHLSRNTSYKHIFETETNILKQNKHVNVLSLVALLKTRDKICFFLPLYTGGTLNEKMEKRMNEKSATFIFKQILSGLQYIHDKGFIHCDLKAENILLGNTSSRPRVIISDFGLSMYRDKKQSKSLWPDSYGTFRNYSPEIFKNEPFDEKVDCWAAGLIFYSLLFGSHPFMKHLDTATIGNHVIEHSILNDEPDMDMNLNISLSAKNIVSRLLEKNPDQRYSCEQCLKSHWIQWSNELDIISVQQDYQYERYLWFQDEPNPYRLNDHPRQASGIVDDLRELRSTKGAVSILKCKRALTLVEDNNEDFLEDIKKAKYPKQNLENFRKRY